MKKKQPTIKDVAKLAGVAPITVSRVIRDSGYISNNTRQRVEAAIEQLNYIPNTLSQSLRFQRTDTIALIVSDITNPFWTTVTRGVEDACSEHGLNVILCNTDEKQDKLENYVNMLLQKQTDGFLLVPTSPNSQAVHTIMKKHIPLVVIDRILSDVEVDMVRSDSEKGAFQLTKYLLDLGHRHIGMLSGPQAISTSEQRIAGYKRALKTCGVPVNEDYITFGGYTKEGGYKMAKYMMGNIQPRPTALFAANNFISVGILKALYEMGISVPAEVSVVGFDDLPFDTIPEPFLTVITQMPYQLGWDAVNLLMEQIEGGNKTGSREIVLPVELIIRQSCAPPATLSR